MEIKKVGVVGCGQMGTGIAQVCAQAGYQVTISEINDELLNKGLAALKSFLARSVERGKLPQQDMDAIISRIRGTTRLPDFADRDLVIEAVPEQMELKKKLFVELDKICPPQAILASNTSSLSVIDMAAATRRPDKILGLHFFNPVPVMKLLEIVRTIATSNDTINTAKDFGKSVGKTTVIAQDAPGFIVNRLLVPFLLNAIRMCEAGIATREDIDAGITLGLNHPMGPLAVSDLVGLDTVYFIASSIYDELKDPQFASPPLLKKMVTAGWLGRKTGKGFFEYK
ncbi:MAG: 3-hydroxybutyryl-CoA dehydrogenase [Chloroflexi bacterium]|nr:3-hydroxybutyryl-CoA dehydrogenase [Chloroflexota bacterium]